MIIMCVIQGVLYNKFNFIKDNVRLVGCLFYLLMIVISILFVKLSKQKLDTIGFKGRWKLSIIIGGILSLIYFYNNCLSHLINGEKLVSVTEIVSLIIFYFVVSASEEIVFRGYIGTRLNGLIKNKYIVLFITGILFIVMHFPYRMIAYGMSLSDLTINNIRWIVDVFIFHLMLSFIYMKTNSICGAILPHWVSDLAYSIILK